MSSNSMLHIAMYPWFAMGHLTPFLHLANKLAERGHRISFLLPPNAKPKLSHFNLHPDLLTFIPITFPRVDALPPGAQTTSDVPITQTPLIATAMDRTQSEIEAKLAQLQPHCVLFDFAHWLPEVTRRLNIKSVLFFITHAAWVAYLLVPAREQEKANPDFNFHHLQKQPLGFPSSSITLKKYEALFIHFVGNIEFGDGVKFHERYIKAIENCDAVAFKTCREMEGKFSDYVQSQCKKPVLLTGPVLPNQPTNALEARWDNWLSKFNKRSVVYVSFGSECRLKKDQFQELLLGLELSGCPFLVALKAPEGVEKIEEALPEGFEERVKERGIVYGGWVQQQLLLGHPSIGCFVTHSGLGSTTEALMSECQMVLLPYTWDQYVSARFMGGDLKVGVEVEKRDEDGWYTRESVSKAVKLVMDEGSEVGKEVRANHDRWREFLLSEHLESSYIDSFVKSLQEIVS